MSTLKGFKLITGEEILGTITGTTEEEVTLSNVYLIQFKDNITLRPYCMCNVEADVTLSYDSILFPIQPSESISTYYFTELSGVKLGATIGL